MTLWCYKTGHIAGSQKNCPNCQAFLEAEAESKKYIDKLVEKKGRYKRPEPKISDY